MKYKRRIILLATIIPLIISGCAIWNINKLNRVPSEDYQKITYNYIYKEIDEIPNFGLERSHQVANKLAHDSRVRLDDIDEIIRNIYYCFIASNLATIVTLGYIIVNEAMRTRENNDGNMDFVINKEMEHQQRLDGYMKYQDEKEKVKLGIENNKNT